MGWLPIALALAGFVFFLAIVNHNSIITHKNAIMLAFFNFCQTAKARHTLLRTLKDLPVDIDKECHVCLFENDFELRHFPDYVACLRHEVRSIEDSRMFLRMNRTPDKETKKIIKSLQVLNHRQFINIKVFRRKVREYNQLIEAYPTKLIAKLTSKEPLQY